MNLKEFVRNGKVAGCPGEQIKLFMRGDIHLQPKQLLASAAARECDHPDGPTAIGYGGARGGGKSHWLLAQMAADDCQRMPGLKCLLLRKVGKSNLENLEDLRGRVMRQVPHLFTSSKNTLSFENGSRIIAGHYQHESDIDAYLGLEYDVIGIEEATTLTHRKYRDISTCCRTSKVLPDGRHWRPRIYCTANPGGVGHAWFKKLFVDPHHKSETPMPKSEASPHDETRNSDSELPPSAVLLRRTDRNSFGLRTSDFGLCGTRFIPATIADNSFINPEYTKILERLSGWQKRAWLHGDWDIAAGQFFTNFRRDIHVIKDFDRLSATEWFAAMDYGYTHYTVVLLGAKDGDGNLFVVDEHCARQWLPKQHFQAIDRMLTRHVLHLGRLERFLTGPDCFATQYTGNSIATQYRDFDINLVPANCDRVGGWAEILRRFGDPDHGIKPSLFIHERCQKLIECLPHLQHDPNRPEDVLKVDTDEDGAGGDDAADALRYLIWASGPRSARAETEVVTHARTAEQGIV